MATTGPVASIPLIPDLGAVVSGTDGGPDTGPQEGENAYRWATVTQVTPLRIQLDGDTQALPITPENLADPDTLRAGLRVWTQLFGRRVIVLGASQGGADVLVPIGGMVPFAGSVAPNVNWKLADGSAISRTVYAVLFAACGTTYGAGDGSTTFNLPDTRNREVMGSGTTYTRGTTATGVVTLTVGNLPAHDHGSVSDHSHSLSGSTGTDGNHGHSGSTDTTGNHGHAVQNQTTRSDITAAAGSTVAANGGGTTGGNGDHSHNVSINSNGDHTHSLSGSAANAGGHTHSSVGSATPFTPTGPIVAVPYLIRVL
jgi:microcystin-dependent protein